MQPAVQAGAGPSVSPPMSPPSEHDSSKQQADHPPSTAKTTSGKAKKRERNSHQSGDSAKGLDNTESKRPRRERNTTNSSSSSNSHNKVEDLGNFVDNNGGLLNSAGADRLYNLVNHHDQTSSPVAYRTWVAGVIAATDREDCLNRFTQLGWLGLLNDWLQEAHKGKLAGNSATAKEFSEESLEDLVMTLLRALEKLPVDLESLKSCNAGKSVSTLRSHKNPEINKKAKKLVDIWKRKVDCEMKQSGETTMKNGPSQAMLWACKPISSSDSSHLLKCTGGSVEGTARNSARTAKGTASNNSSSTLGEGLTKPIPFSLEKKSSAFSASSGCIKENPSSHIEGSNPPTEVFSASIPDERSSNNQPPSNDNGLICANGQSKSSCPMASTKSGSSSRPHMSARGISGIGVNETCKDAGLGKPLVWSRSLEKSSGMSIITDKSQNDSGKMEASSNQRLIVRLPISGRSPVLNINVEPGAPTSRSSPPHKHSSLGPDSFHGKSRSQTASSTDDARTAFSIETGGTPGLAYIYKPSNLPERGNEEVVGQCKAGGEVDCHSSESQLSFSSSVQCYTARLNESPPHQTQPIDDIQGALQWKGEKCSGRVKDAENIGICLLACVAADESSWSGKDIAFTATTKNKHFKDGELLERANAFAESAKPHQNSSTMQVLPNADAMDVQKSIECQKPCSAWGLENLEITAVEVMGQSDENTRAFEEFSAEHKSPKNVLKGTTLPWDNSALGHLQNELLSSSSGKGHLEDNAEKGELKIYPSRDYNSQADIPIRDILDDKKQVLHHSRRNAVDASFTLTESGRNALHEDSGRDKKDYKSETATESSFRLPREDALEVAVLVAKEVEKKYGKAALEKGNPKANTDLEKIVISKDNLESQFAKEYKQTIIDGSKDAEKDDLNMHAQLDGNSSPANSTIGKLEGKIEKLDYKETAAPSACSPYKNREHSTCSFQVFDGGPHAPNKVKHAVDDLQHASPYSSKPSQSTICNQLRSLEVLTSPNTIRSRTATPEQTAKEQSSADAEAAPEHHDFDLNEGAMLDECSQEPTAVYCAISPIPIIPVVPHSVVSSSLSTPIAVVVSTKGAFVPPVSPFKGKGDLGWRGSAATSAFRPAEPRKLPERNPDRCQAATETHGKLSDRKPDRSQITIQLASGAKAAQLLMDFDLNVADEGLLQDEIVSPVEHPAQSSFPSTPSNGLSGVRLDLDLNQADESEEYGSVLALDQIKTDVIAISGRSYVSFGGAKPIKHDFDLNDGPSIDDALAADDSNASHGNVRILGNQASPLPVLKIGSEMINLSPWSHTGGPVSAIAMQTFPSMRSETPFPVAAPHTFFNVCQGQGFPSFHADMFRPTAGFSSSTSAAYSYPAQAPVFPYTSYSFGFSSAPFPAASPSFLDSSGSHPYPSGASQILTSGAIPPPHVRPPYLRDLTKITTPLNNDKIWSRPSLDLNAGPELSEAETREGRVSVRQATVFEYPLLIDEQTRVFCQPAVSADSLKRKEPEGGWEFYRSGLKQDTQR